MKLLHDNYLDQMNEELEIINFQLDCMYEAAFVSNDTSDYDNFSLLENVNGDSGELTIMNEEAYEVYMESLNDSLKKIWNAIKRFVKSIFTSSGETITSKDAKNIIEIISSAAADGDLQSSALKKVAQKGFYLIAGLGTSVDGDKLRQAYESGEVLRFVTQNINKINVGKIPEGARFRICIAHYDSTVKNSMTMIKYVLEVLRDKGIAGIEAMGKNIKSTVKTVKKGAAKQLRKAAKALESYEDDITDLDEMLESLGIFTEETKDEYNLRKLKNKQKKAGNNIKDLKDQVENLQKTNDFYNKQIQGRNEEIKRLENNVEYYAQKLNMTMGQFEAYRNELERIIGLNKQQTQEIMAKTKDINELKALLKGSENEKAEIIAQMKEERRISEEQFLRMGENMKKLVKSATMTGRIQGAAVAGGAAVLAYGIAAIVNKVKQKRGNSPTNDHLAMATITYVNENAPDAMAKIRLYGPSGVTNIDIKGRDKVFALRDHLSELADRMGAEGDKLTPGVAEQVREFATNINLFFSGLATRK